VILLILTHWMACIFHYTAEIEKNDGNWIMAYSDDPGMSTFSRYVVSVYWAIVTLSSVGYGDIVPKTEAETIVLTFCILAGSSIYAWLLGMIISLTQELEQQKVRYYKLRDELNHFMDEKDLPQELRRRLRQYLRMKNEARTLFDWSEVSSMLSRSLQEEVAQFTEQEFILANPMFMDATLECMSMLARCSKRVIFAKGDNMITNGDEADSMYIIRTGLVAHMGLRLMGKGDIVGEDMITAITLRKGFHNNVRYYLSVALSFTVCSYVHISDLTAIFDQFPNVAQEAMRHVIIRTFKQHIWAYSNATRRLQGQKAIKRNVPDFLVRHYEAKLESMENNRKFTPEIVLIQSQMRRVLAKRRVQRIKQVRNEEWSLRGFEDRILSELNYIKRHLQSERVLAMTPQ